MENNIENLMDHIKQLVPEINDKELDLFKRELSVTSLKNREFYLQANTTQSKIGYIVKGLLRVFYIDKKGNEITVNFVQENGIATHYTALIEKQPNKYWFQCLEPIIIVDIPYQHLTKCCQQSHNIEHFARILVERVFLSQQERLEGFLFDDAEMRYVNFTQRHKDLFNRVSITDLSSYLGIGRQSLTRIRKKLSKTAK